MGGSLDRLKNIIWAFCIVLCLLMVLVGLVFAAFSRYDGEQESGRILLGDAVENVSGSKDKQPEPLPPLSGDGMLHELGETGDGGQDYIDSLTFLCDSTWIGLRDYGMLSGGTASNQVWGSSAGNIPAGTISGLKVLLTSDGSEVSAADAAMILKPKRLVISLGMDGLSGVTREDFISDYTALINSIHASSPDTVIVCCGLSSVTMDYPSIDGLTAVMAMDTSDWIKQVCIDTGAYYTDPGSELRDGSGYLLSEYASANGKALNSAALDIILSYLRTHMA